MFIWWVLTAVDGAHWITRPAAMEHVANEIISPWANDGIHQNWLKSHSALFLADAGCGFVMDRALDRDYFLEDGHWLLRFCINIKWDYVLLQAWDSNMLSGTQAWWPCNIMDSVANHIIAGKAEICECQLRNSAKTSQILFNSVPSSFHIRVCLIIGHPQTWWFIIMLATLW